jgi:CRISPR system Cascade subunit CasB
MARSSFFSKGSPTGDALAEWWNGLAANPGARADLRRAHDLTAVVISPAFQRFRRRMVMAGLPEDESRQDRLAVLAGVLVHLNASNELRLPQAMRGEDKPRVSELRFRRLLDSPSMEDLFTGLRRVLPLIDSAADIHQLAADIWYWGDKVRKRWAYDYPWPAKTD